MEIKKIGVIGAGAMGNGIAQMAAQIGCEVILRDIKEEYVERGMKNIDRFLSKKCREGENRSGTERCYPGQNQGHHGNGRPERR